MHDIGRSARALVQLGDSCNDGCGRAVRGRCCQKGPAAAPSETGLRAPRAGAQRRGRAPDDPAMCSVMSTEMSCAATPAPSAPHAQSRSLRPARRPRVCSSQRAARRPRWCAASVRSRKQPSAVRAAKPRTASTLLARIGLGYRV
jgi:hypothetical protein